MITIRMEVGKMVVSAYSFSLFEFCWRGKSELHRARCSVTRSGSNPKESATENIPPCLAGFSFASQGKGEMVGPLLHGLM